MRKNIKPITATVFKKYLGSSTDESGTIIAIESYVGNVPTFTWKSGSGHLYCYLPVTAFCSGELKDFVDFNCLSYNFAISDLDISGNGFGMINGKEIKWDKYLFSIDWYDANELAHLVISDKKFYFIKNHKFQIGGNKLSLPNWKKCRSEWKI